MIKSVEKAIDILETIQINGGELSVTEISKILGYEISTTHNLIRTLAGKNYLIQPPGTRSYRLGPRLLKLIEGTLFEDELNRRLTPAARQLADETGENVVIAGVFHDEWRRIVRVEVANTLTVNVDHLDDPFYAYASGRLYLAQLPHRKLRELVDRIGLPGENWPEVETVDDLDAALEPIRQAGHAVVHSPSGVTALAAPLPVKGLAAPLALCIFLPGVRCDGPTEKKLTAALLGYAKRMTDEVKALKLAV